MVTHLFEKHLGVYYYMYSLVSLLLSTCKVYLGAMLLISSTCDYVGGLEGQ